MATALNALQGAARIDFSALDGNPVSAAGNIWSFTTAAGGAIKMLPGGAEHVEMSEQAMTLTNIKFTLQRDDPANPGTLISYDILGTTRMGDAWDGTQDQHWCTPAAVENRITAKINAALGTGSPMLTAFTISGQAASQQAPVNIPAGNLVVKFTITDPGNVDGDLSLHYRKGSEAQVEVATDIDPEDSDGTVTVQLANAIALAAGESVVFTLSGTGTAATGAQDFQRQYTVTAQAASTQEYIYVSWESDTDASDATADATTQVAYAAGSQSVPFPATSLSSAHLTILQKASLPPITGIVIDGLNQFSSFTRTDDAQQVGGAEYDAYVSDNPLLTSLFAGQSFTIQR